MTIDNIQQALPVAIECIQRNVQNDSVAESMPYNQGRHYLLRTKNGLKYWLLYKRDFFKSFGTIFGFKGVGESINREWVEYALAEGTDAFLFIYSSGYCYIVPPKEFKDFAEKNNTVRTLASGEVTYSIPVKLLRRWL
jgi:hypothetical protein